MCVVLEEAVAKSVGPEDRDKTSYSPMWKKEFYAYCCQDLTKPAVVPDDHCCRSMRHFLFVYSCQHTMRSSYS